MQLPLLLADALDQAGRIDAGLLSGGMRYLFALSLFTNGALFVIILRLQHLRVKEARERARADREMAKELGGLVAQHVHSATVLDRATEIFMSTQPRKRNTHPPSPVSEKTEIVPREPPR